MAVKIRLARHGSKKRPHYDIVVANSNAPRDGSFIERVGHYNPMLARDHAERVVLDVERVNGWLGKGAEPSEKVAAFIAMKGGHFPEKLKNKIEQKLKKRVARQPKKQNA